MDHNHVAKSTAHRSFEGRMEARKLRILTGQRHDLEHELQTLQNELDALVKYLALYGSVKSN